MAKQSKEEILESGVIHFSIGEDMGITIMNIAQEKLICEYNPQKAIKVITDSLIGCPEDLALQILKGELIIGTDVESQECYVTERISEVHDKFFPKVNWVKWYENKEFEICKTGRTLIALLKAVEGKMRAKVLYFSVEYKTVFSFIADGDKELLNDIIQDSEEVNEIELLIKTIKNYIEKSLEIKKAMDWVFKTFNDLFDGYDGRTECSTTLTEVMNMFKGLMNGETDFNREYEDDSVSKYIEAVKEIDNVLSNKIEPVDIMKNYSAGWLSPQGMYYALNGEIANMLHIQIADALQKDGIIPSEEEMKKLNCTKDMWLERNGWVEIHGSNVQFAGCLNKGQGLKNLNITKVQKSMIYKYIQVCHNGTIKLGWRLTQISAARFDMMDNEYMNENYFEY